MNSGRYLAYLLVVAMLSFGGCAQTPKKKPVDGTKKAEINTQLGIEYLRKGMRQSSMDKLQKALKQDSSYAPAHEAIAVLYEQLGETNKATKHYQRSLSIDRKNPSTLNNYGQFLCRHNKLKKAEGFFLEAVADPLYRYPEMIYTNAGICAGKAPDVRKAEGYFRKALQINQNYAPALKEMVHLSYAQNNFLGTRAYLQRYEATSKLTPGLLWVAVQTEAQLGDKNAVSSYALLLKKQHPESAQTAALRKWENERKH